MSFKQFHLPKLIIIHFKEVIITFNIDYIVSNTEL